MVPELKKHHSSQASGGTGGLLDRASPGKNIKSWSLSDNELRLVERVGGNIMAPAAKSWNDGSQLLAMVNDG